MPSIPPGLAIRALETGFDRVRQAVNNKRLATLVDRVAAIGNTDPLEAQRLIESALEKEWGYRLMEHHFRQLKESVNSRAEVAIAAMMAEYLHGCRGPDREYKLTGGLLGEADAELLEALGDLASSFDEVSDDVQRAVQPASQGIAFHVTRYVEGLTGEFIYRPGDGSDKFSAPVICRPLLHRTALALLTRYEFGDPVVGRDLSSMDDPSQLGSEDLWVVRSDAIGRFRRLHNYITISLATPETHWRSGKVPDADNGFE